MYIYNICIYIWKLWITDTSTIYPSNKDLGYGTYHTSGPQIRVGHNRGHHQVSEDVPKVRILGTSTVLLRIIGKQPPIYCILQMETWKIIKSGGKIYLYIYSLVTCDGVFLNLVMTTLCSRDSIDHESHETRWSTSIPQKSGCG